MSGKGQVDRDNIVWTMENNSLTRPIDVIQSKDYHILNRHLISQRLTGGYTDNKETKG